MNRIVKLFLVALLVLAGSTASAGEADNPPAPEFKDNLPWLNVSRPLSMKALRGKVVLLDFWTYGCINCMHVIPDLKKLEAKYGNKLAVVSVHSPKFDNEKNLATLRSIVVRYGLEHPVVNDVDFSLWNRYGLRAWPTLVLIDPAGSVVGMISGEGHYALLDKAIGDLLGKFAGRFDETPLPIALERDKRGKSLLAAPGKIASDGKLVAIADTLNQRIVLADANGKLLRSFGDGVAGLKDGKSNEARFSAPLGVTFGNGGIYVADTGNHVIRFIDLTNGTVTSVAGNGEMERPAGREYPATRVGLSSPWDVLFHDGQLYIALGGSHQLWRLDVKSARLYWLAGSGHEELADGNPSQAAFAQPSGLALFDGKLYVADAEVSALRRVDLKSGKVDTLAGKGLFDFGDRDGEIRSARLQHPLAVAALDGRRLLVADTYNHKLKLYDGEARTLTSLAGSGKPGSGMELNEPGGLAVLGDAVLVADTNNNRIVRYDLKSRKLTEWTIRE